MSFVCTQSEQGWLFSARPENLASVICEADLSKLRPLTPLDLTAFKNEVAVCS